MHEAHEWARAEVPVGAKVGPVRAWVDDAPRGCELLQWPTVCVCVRHRTAGEVGRPQGGAAFRSFFIFCVIPSFGFLGPLLAPADFRAGGVLNIVKNACTVNVAEGSPSRTSPIWRPFLPMAQNIEGLACMNVWISSELSVPSLSASAELKTSISWTCDYVGTAQCGVVHFSPYRCAPMFARVCVVRPVWR